MKLLLIYPPEKNIGFESAPSMVAEEAGFYPPLGLISIATSVLERGKHEVKLLDTIAERMDYRGIEEYVAKEKPDIVGVRLITDYLRDGILTAKSVKNVNPGIKIIAGGHHTTIYPRETIQLEEIDCVVIGDGEEIINDILDRLGEGRQIDDLPGVLTKTNYGTAKLDAIRVEDLNKLPLLKRDIVDYRKYVSVLTMGNPITTMMTSRGCPFHCPYCSGGRIPLRSLAPDRVVNEIESCVKLGIRDILIFDETFTMNKKRITAICDEIISRKLKVRWHARTRIDCIDRDIAKKMKKAGCRLLQFGIETGSQRLQAVLDRNFKLEKFEEVIRMAREEGILTYGNFMINLPDETVEEMQMTINFAIKLNLDYAVFSILSLFPKTAFYEQAFSEKLITEDFWKSYAQDPLNYEMKNVFWPGKHTEEFLNRMVRDAYMRFYARPGYMIKQLFRPEPAAQKLIKIKSGLKLITRFLKI